MARLIRLWLMLSKQEGVEVKTLNNKNFASKEGADPSGVSADDSKKGVKKDDKKEERGKSAGLMKKPSMIPNKGNLLYRND